jgi:hypothetical protein
MSKSLRPGPYYERLGFGDLKSEEETPSLRAIGERERISGLTAWPRATMRPHV